MGALFLVLVCLLIPAAAGTLLFGLATHDQEITVLGAALAGMGMLCGFTQFVLASKARCPLCMTPPLASKHCSKHREARRLFGSYRLRAAIWMLTRGHFRCPYCNEPTVLEARERRLDPVPAMGRPRRR
jgi:hypothetical protein